MIKDFKLELFDNLLAAGALTTTPCSEMKAHPLHNVAPDSFRRLEPWFEELDDINDRMFVNPESDTGKELGISLVGKTVEVATIRMPMPDDQITDRYQIYRLYKPDLKSLRGRLPRMFPNIYAFSNVSLQKDGKYRSAISYAIPENDGRSWKFLAEEPEYRDTRRLFKPNGVLFDTDGRPINRVLPWLVSVAFTNRYEWSVEFKHEKYGPSFDLKMPPRAMLELFKFRDVPDGKKRRASLRNWVQDYWRQPKENGEAVYVRKHLRGSMQFTMDNLTFNVHVSDFDREQNENAK